MRETADWLLKGRLLNLLNHDIEPPPQLLHAHQIMCLIGRSKHLVKPPGCATRQQWLTEWLT
jgi:hypothetical protein